MNREAFLLLPDDVRSEWERMAFLHGVYERALQRACSIQGVPDQELVAIHVAKATVELREQRPEAWGRAFGTLPSLERLSVVTGRMRQQVFDAGSTRRIHEEDVLEAARLVDALRPS